MGEFGRTPFNRIHCKLFLRQNLFENYHYEYWQNFVSSFFLCLELCNRPRTIRNGSN
jgi:hypothetical protein